MRMDSRRKRELSLFLKVFLVAIVLGAIPTSILTFFITRNHHVQRVATLEASFADLQHVNSILRRNIEVVDRFTGGEVEESSEDDWKLRLVNSHFQLELDYSVDLAEVENGLLVDRRIVDTTREMLSSMRAEGLRPVIVSAFRSNTRQRELLNLRVQELIDVGYAPFDAFEQINLSLAVPGSSEHALGLALDIASEHNTTLDGWTELSPEWLWLQNHSWRYGFILRYPEGKSHITGVIYEPWHFRYVGREAAEQIFTQGVTLEEFLGIIQVFTNVTPNAGFD